MAYVGPQPKLGRNREVDDIPVDLMEAQLHLLFR